GSKANAATGALGISRRIWATAGNARRIATNIPPALTLRAVANSKKSLPFPSRLRTKTGIASGNRVHFRRSVDALVPFMQTSPSALALPFEAPHGPNLGQIPEQTARASDAPIGFD